jgi:hypothetical protein
MNFIVHGVLYAKKLAKSIVWTNGNYQSRISMEDSEHRYYGPITNNI